MIKKTLVIVPCGFSKIWDKKPNAGPTLASLAYTGQPFIINKQYAESFGDKWVILSAKYGFISPDFVIPEQYNITFLKKSTGPISIASLREQIQQMKLDDFDVVIGLGGKEYRFAIQESFNSYPIELRFPFAGLPIGKMMQATKQALKLI